MVSDIYVNTFDVFVPFIVKRVKTERKTRFLFVKTQRIDVVAGRKTELSSLLYKTFSDI